MILLNEVTVNKEVDASVSSKFMIESMLVPDLFQSSNNGFAVDLPRFPRIAIRVTADGMYPNAATRRPISGSPFELGLMTCLSPGTMQVYVEDLEEGAL